MLANFDLSTVHHFRVEFASRLMRCEHAEGTACSSLDESIRCLVELCEELRGCINAWAGSVFAGQTPFDSAVEDLWKAETQELLRRAIPLAACGRMMNGQCYELDGLNALHYYIADFDYLLRHWVSPRPSVSPAPRLRIPTSVERQILESLRGLEQLSNSWRPTDPDQLVFFQRQPAK